MTYRPLKEKTNRYVTQNGSYTNVDGDFYAQTDLGNTQQVISSGVKRDFTIDDLIVVEDVSIYFVVKIGNEYYTSKRLKDDLVSASEEVNPYFSIEYVTLIEINQDRVNTQIQNRRDNGERTARVSVERTLDNPIDIVKQIDWTTRPVSVSGDESSHVIDIGEWSVDRLGDEVYDFRNSVRIIEPDPRTDVDDDEGNDTDINGEPDEDHEKLDRTDGEPGSRTTIEPRREQPRTGGGVREVDDELKPTQDINVR